MDQGSRYLSRLIQSDGIYVVTATIKSKKILVSAKRSDGTTASADVPVVQGALSGKVKVESQGDSSSGLVYEGDKPLVFGFQATRILFKDGQYDGLEVIDPGSVAMRSLDAAGPAVGEAPVTEGDPRLVVFETRRSPMVRVGGIEPDPDELADLMRRRCKRRAGAKRSSLGSTNMPI